MAPLRPETFGPGSPACQLASGAASAPAPHYEWDSGPERFRLFLLTAKPPRAARPVPSIRSGAGSGMTAGDEIRRPEPVYLADPGRALMVMFRYWFIRSTTRIPDSSFRPSPLISIVRIQIS